MRQPENEESTLAAITPFRVGAVVYRPGVAVGRTGAILGRVILAGLAVDVGIWSAFGLPGGFWLIGVAAALWWAPRVDARGIRLDDRCHRSEEAHEHRLSARRRSIG